MQFKSFINSPCGLQYVFADLQLQSGLSRQTLLESNIMTDIESIQTKYKTLKYFYTAVCNKSNLSQIQLLQFKLCELKDINVTIKRLSNKITLDDIELFEIKSLAILAFEVSKTIKEINLENIIEIPDTEQIINILDPDGLKMASFYIYDSYSEELRELRSKLKRKPNSEELYIESQAIENRIRTDITNKLFIYSDKLVATMACLSEIDINIAKAIQIEKNDFCFPSLSKNGKSEYKKMFNPEIKDNLLARGLNFQNIDIDFSNGATVITGANMGGKTVVLKTLTLCQILYQFGFGIPAKEACIDLKNKIFFCIGDEQSSVGGLSSFGAEMKNINTIIQTAKNNNEKILALIDEPARTTNPIEGTALVSALVKILQNKNINIIITTHYDIDSYRERRLRVKGLENGQMNYELVETQKGEVPHEALNIAQSLGIDSEWLNCAKQILIENKKS